MAGFGPEGERSGESLPAFQRKTPEPIEPQRGRPADGSWAPGVGHEQRWQERSHEELVAGFRRAIRQEQQALGELAKYHSPVTIIDSAFSREVQYLFSDNPAEIRRGEFFAPIKSAWEIIAYDHYGQGSLNTGDLERHYAGLALDGQYQRAKVLNHPHPELIRLTDPLQMKILDAAAEAVDIPHRKGQADFIIPAHVRGLEARLWQAYDEGR